MPTGEAGESQTTSVPGPSMLHQQNVCRTLLGHTRAGDARGPCLGAPRRQPARADAVAPGAGWRPGHGTDRRTPVDGAHGRKEWCPLHAPPAERVTRGLDPLQTPPPSAREEALAPAAAPALLDRCALPSPPHHGRWRTRAASACSALQRPGWDRHRPDPKTRRAARAAGKKRRNAQGVHVPGRFTTAEARIRRQRLSPAMKN